MTAVAIVAILVGMLANAISAYNLRTKRRLRAQLEAALRQNARLQEALRGPEA